MNSPTPLQSPIPDPQQVMCDICPDCGHTMNRHCRGQICNGDDHECMCDLSPEEIKVKHQLSIATAELTRLKSACTKEHESVQKLDEENQRLRVQLVNLSNAASIFSGHMEVVLVSLRTELSKSQEALNQTTESEKL